MRSFFSSCETGTVQSPFLVRFNQSCQGMVDAGDTKTKSFTIFVPRIPNPSFESIILLPVPLSPYPKKSEASISE